MSDAKPWWECEDWPDRLDAMAYGLNHEQIAEAAADAVGALVGENNQLRAELAEAKKRIENLEVQLLRRTLGER